MASSLTSSLLSKHLAKVIKAQEKDGRLSLIQNTLVFPFSTGSLALDYFYGGGILPRLYTFAGPEQSGKSLFATTILASAFKNDVDVLVYFDAEETLNGETVGTLFGVKKVDELFNSRKEGKIELPPRLHVFKGNSLEGVMDSITAIIESLPDKVYINDEQAWFFKFDKSDKEAKSLLETLALAPDDKATKKYGCDKFIFCKDPKSKPNSSGVQAVIVIDSLASLLADTEKEDGPTQQMALEARRFSKHLKRFVGNLNKKQVTVIATNHVKENPNTTYGIKEYEPGGNSIKFYASVQTRIASISSSTAGWGGAGPVFEEESVYNEALKDKYQFKRFKLIKDKVGGGVSTTTLQRVWIEDCFGESWGFDPVLDTIEYLRLTKQLEENRGRYTVKVAPLQEKSFTFKQLKKFILSSSIDDPRYKLSEEAYKQEFKLDVVFNLRAYCFSQIASGEIFKYTESFSTDLQDNESIDPETGEIIGLTEDRVVSIVDL
jgi:RecA/RadA recombinase